MRVWSRGLGRVELAADIRRAKALYEGGTLIIVGKTEPPVSWDFVVSLNSAELWDIAEVVLNRHGLKFVGRYSKLRFLNRKQLRVDHAKAIAPRTGIKPDQEFGPILAKTRQQQQTGETKPTPKVS